MGSGPGSSGLKNSWGERSIEAKGDRTLRLNKKKHFFSGKNVVDEKYESF